jgi:hypothetical protein
MGRFGAEPAAQRGEEMRDNENQLTNLGKQRPRNFHIEIVAEASI